MQNVEWHFIAGLVKALNWFDNSLQNVLASRGFAPVHRTQSLILVHIASGVRSPADIAREMGLTRQNVHQMTKLLIESGLVEQRQHPEDPRRIQYGLTESSADIRTAALEALNALTELMAMRTRATAADLRVFRRLLAADWGPIVADFDEMQARLEAKGAPGKTTRAARTRH